MSATLQLLYRAAGATLLPLLAYTVLSADRIRAFSSAPVQLARPSDEANAGTPLHDIIVVGGGSAGLTAAKFAANFGNSVALIEGSKLGGDCTWTGCVPSKTLLAEAKKCWTWRKMNEKYCATTNLPLREFLSDVKGRIDDAREFIYAEDDSPEVLRTLGIDVIEGKAQLLGPREVVVSDSSSSRCVKAKFGIVVATGASVRDPSDTIQGLDTCSYWTYENVWQNFFSSTEKVNRKIIVVGGGPIGCELSQALNRLGCKVTLVSSSRLVPATDKDASSALLRVFQSEGIEVIHNQKVTSVSRLEGDKIRVTLGSNEVIEGDHILVATGRVPNSKGLGLEQLGVEIGQGRGITVDDDLQTSVKGIFAAGDCTGDEQFTHYAGYQGAIAARNLLLPLKDRGRLNEVPSTTFTDPEISTMGLDEDTARQKFGSDAVSVSFRDLSEVDRAVCEGIVQGFIKLVYDTKSRKIYGATIMSPSSGEMISELAVAKASGLTFDKLSTVMHTYPSYSISLQQMAADVYYEKLKRSKSFYDVLKKIGI